MPGVPMETGDGGAAGCHVLSVAGQRLEFVVNNGRHDWCAAARASEPAMVAAPALVISRLCCHSVLLDDRGGCAHGLLVTA